MDQKFLYRLVIQTWLYELFLRGSLVLVFAYLHPVLDRHMSHSKNYLQLVYRIYDIFEE